MTYDADAMLNRLLDADAVDCGDGDVVHPDAVCLLLLGGDYPVVMVRSDAIDDDEDGSGALRMAARVLADAVGCALVPLAGGDEAEA